MLILAETTWDWASSPESDKPIYITIWEKTYPIYLPLTSFIIVLKWIETKPFCAEKEIGDDNYAGDILQYRN